MLGNIFTNVIALRRIIFLALVSAGALWAPSSYAVDQTVTKFGSLITLPSTTATGTILARDYVSMQQICGAATCSINAVSLWPYGGASPAPGPEIATNVSGVSARLLINGKPQAAMDFTGATVISRQPLEVQLIRDSRTLEPGSLAGGQGGANPAYFYLCDRETSGHCKGENTKLGIVLSGTIQLIAGTCQVPDRNLALPGISSTRFGGVGTTAGFAGSKSFDLQFNNCPAGFARVGYTVAPIGAPSQSIDGTLPLGTGSTAAGVGIQLVDRSNAPLPLNKSITLSAYDKSTGGSYSIPLVAQYIQTGATIKPGTVRGSAQILVDYQ
ncbi:fimbrial protein [Burkholderia sp. Bp9125]|nr:fimbrial protein [Burkholderia sp. Bp9125]